MISESKIRRTAGFIRNSSSKKHIVPVKSHQYSSSDSFSSFENQRREEKQTSRQFSPFRHPKRELQFSSRPPLPSKLNHRNFQTAKMFENEKFKNNYIETIESPSRGKIYNVHERLQIEKRKKTEQIEKDLADIGKVCQKIQSSFNSIENQIQPQESKEDNCEYQDLTYSFNPKNQLQAKKRLQIYSEIQKQRNSENISNNVIKENQQSIKQRNKFPFQSIPKNYDFDESSVSADEEEEEDSSIYFYDKNQPFRKQIYSQKRQVYPEREIKLKIEHQQAREKFISENQIQDERQQDDNEEELITQYRVNQFKNSHLRKYGIMNQQNRVQKETQSNMYRTKGGMCFQLDVNEFHQPVKIPQKPKAQKKVKKINQKQQILKRRQMAKNYSKQARMRVFGGY